jgi:hypothetical protein
MKVFALIFSVFFFTASVFPCADVCEDIGMIASSHHDTSANTTQDTCPIFCICNCCGIVFETSISTPTIASPYTFTASFGLFLLNDPTSDYNTSVWQPPKQA